MNQRKVFFVVVVQHRWNVMWIMWQCTSILAAQHRWSVMWINHRWIVMWINHRCNVMRINWQCTCIFVAQHIKCTVNQPPLFTAKHIGSVPCINIQYTLSLLHSTWEMYCVSTYSILYLYCTVHVKCTVYQPSVYFIFTAQYMRNVLCINLQYI